MAMTSYASNVFGLWVAIVGIGCLDLIQGVESVPTELSVNGLLDGEYVPFVIDEQFVMKWQNGDGLGFEVEVASEWTKFPDASHAPSMSFGSGGFSWTSGPITSNMSLYQLPNTVTKLFGSRKTFQWRVRTSSTPATWSSVAHFDTAPSNADFGESTWIGGGSEVQTQFVLPNTPIVRARAYATGLGSYKMWINGKQVDDHIMDPGEAVYDQKVLYAGHNITSMFVSGENTITGQIGNSKWGYLDIYTNRTALGDQSGDSSRAFLALITITFLDGTEKTFTTNPNWKARHGPIVYDHLWHGEIVDMRKVDAPWFTAHVMHPNAGRLYPQLMAPIRNTQSFSAVSTHAINGTYQFDFGYNMAGVETLELPVTSLAASSNSSFAAGVIMVRLEHTEITDSTSEAYNNFFPGMEFGHASKTCSMSDWYNHKWYECANQTDGIIFEWPLTAPLSYTPTFTYHGFRYVSMTAVQILADGSEAPLSKEMEAAFPFGAHVTAHRSHSDVKQIATVNLQQQQGSDTASTAMATLLGKTFNATMASHVSNLWGIPTDCPQREKRGWMGDAGISSSSLNTFYDAFAFHANFVRLIVDNQVKGCRDQPNTSIYKPCHSPNNDPNYFNGSVPDVTPFATGPYGGNPGTTDWQVAFVVIARNLLLHHGQLAVPVLTEIWPGLASFMDYLDRLVDKSTGLLLSGARGDWVPPAGSTKTSAQECAAFWHTLCLGFMAEIATAIGRGADAQRYTARLSANQVAYHNHFYDKVLHTYGIGSQCSHIFALHVGAVPKDLIAPVAASLVAKIQKSSLAEARGGTGPHLEIGIFGTTYVFDVLHATGYDAVALQVLNQTTYPSLGYMIANDATTLWEAWDGDQHHIGKGGTSRNHIMFGGGVNRFIAAAVGGLTVENRPMAATEVSGWRLLKVHPSSAAITSMNQASHFRKTPNGNAAVAWKRSLETPPTAQTPQYQINVTVPFGSRADVRIPLLTNSASVTNSEACSFSCQQDQSVVVANACGEYECDVRSHDGEVSIRVLVGPGFHTYTHA